MVFKLVEINGTPKIKLSNEIEKITIPGKKIAHRLYGRDGTMILDLLLDDQEGSP